MKHCSGCDQTKDEECFHLRKASKDGRVSRCKNCIRGYDQHYRKRPEVDAKRKVRHEAWRATDRCKEYHRIYNVEHRKERAAVNRKWRLSHPEEMKQYREKWAQKDKIENPDRVRRYAVERRATNIQSRLKDSLRARLRAALREDFKGGSAVKDLGCSIEQFKKLLESEFRPGMTWDNYGRGPGTWQIDHIMPMAAFDLTNRQHVLLACHYGNLQPLWFEENTRKADKLPYAA